MQQAKWGLEGQRSRVRGGHTESSGGEEMGETRETERLRCGGKGVTLFSSNFFLLSFLVSYELSC